MWSCLTNGLVQPNQRQRSDNDATQNLECERDEEIRSKIWGTLKFIPPFPCCAWWAIHEVSRQDCANATLLRASGHSQRSLELLIRDWLSSPLSRQSATETLSAQTPQVLANSALFVFPSQTSVIKNLNGTPEFVLRALNPIDSARVVMVESIYLDASPERCRGLMQPARAPSQS